MRLTVRPIPFYPILAVCILLAAPWHAAAQTDGTDQIVKATETPWTVSCQPTADGASLLCQVDKQLNTANPASLIAQVSVFMDGGKLMMRIIAPHQLSIANGLDLEIDGEDMGKQAFTTTVQAGAVALFPVSQQLLANARKGKDFKVLSRTISGRNISFSVSLVGFAASLRRSCNRRKGRSARLQDDVEADRDPLAIGAVDEHIMLQPVGEEYQPPGPRCIVHLPPVPRIGLYARLGWPVPEAGAEPRVLEAEIAAVGRHLHVIRRRTAPPADGHAWRCCPASHICSGAGQQRRYLA